MTDDSHRVLRESMGAFVLGHLEETEAARVRAHLDGCDACRAEYAELAPLAVALLDVDPEALDRLEEPGALLGRRIEAEVAAERSHLRRRRVLGRAVLGAAACLVLVLAFVAGAALTGDEPMSPVPLEAVPVTSDVSGVAASADLVDHTWGVEIKLTATGLEDGAAYTTTVRGEDGVEYPAGQFIGVADVEIRCNMNASVLREDSESFTVWDSRGEPVMRAVL